MLTYQDFEILELADNLLNIWSDAKKRDDPILDKYVRWNIDIARQKWKPEYQNFSSVIHNILTHDKSLNFGQICSAEKELAHYLIHEDVYFFFR